MLIRTIATALAVTALALQSTSVQASEGPKVLVIADTGFDTQLPLLQDRIIHEACILDWYLCPNGTNFQEGPETASLPLRISQIGGFGHGTQMASVAALTDANVKFILIRIIAYSSNGTRLPAQDSSVVRLLDWVLANKDKFNIGAVAMAQGHHSLLSTRDYCPKTPAVEKRILEFPLFFQPVIKPIKKRLIGLLAFHRRSLLGHQMTKTRLPNSRILIAISLTSTLQAIPIASCQQEGQQGLVVHQSRP